MNARLVVGAAIAVMAAAGCATPPVDPALAGYIANIRAIDNHTHVNTTVAKDSEADALPLDGIPPFPMPVRLRPENTAELVDAYRGLYGYPYQTLDSAHLGFAHVWGRMSRFGESGWIVSPSSVRLTLPGSKFSCGPLTLRLRIIINSDPLLDNIHIMADATPCCQTILPVRVIRHTEAIR